MRVQLRDEPARNNQSRGFVFDQIRHELHDCVFDVIVQLKPRVPGYRGLGIPLRGHGLGVQARRIVGPYFDFVDQMKIELRTSAFHCRSPSGEAPSAGSVSNDTVGVCGVGLARALRSSPSFRFGAAVDDRRPCGLLLIARLKLEAVAFVATPGTEIDFELRSRARDGDRLTRARLAQCPLDQQVASFGKPERAEIDVYLHCAATPLTNESIVPKRSMAAASCA